MISPLPYCPVHRSRNGIALVLVLACLVLLSILVVAFLNSVKTDIQSSKAYSDDNGTRMLADAAANIVMSQIRQATTAATATGLTSWASQPGMIRTYDNGGNPETAYKLYSSAQMEEPATTMANGTAFLASELLAATGTNNWFSSPAVYTDLNQPVITSSGTFYPILSDTSTLALTTGTIDGYSVSGAPVATTGGNPNPVPMPAQWLYILQSGSVVAPVATSGTTVTVTGATSANPIVGRIAFWTDDETCKVNINTAGGDGVMAAGSDDPTPIATASFWAPPCFCSYDDSQLANSQPAVGEYQRYPGHPGTVSFMDPVPQS